MALFGTIFQGVKKLGKGLFPAGTKLGKVFGSTRKKGSGVFGTGIGIGPQLAKDPAPKPAQITKKSIDVPQDKKDNKLVLFGLGFLLILGAVLAFKN